MSADLGHIIYVFSRIFPFSVTRNGMQATRGILALDWDSFSAALEDTPVGNNSCGMLPFFGPEISPRRNASGPTRFGGDTSFQNAENPTADVRASVEGQFLNMKLQSGHTPPHWGSRRK